MDFLGESVSSSSGEVNPVEARLRDFKERNKQMLQSIEVLGWSMPEDPDLAEMAMASFEMFEEELPVFTKAVVKAARLEVDPWIQKKVLWEQGLTEQKVKEQRTEFMACAMRKDVSEEYLEDCQKRWENDQFTEVTKDHLVVGDLFARNQGSSVRERLELDVESEFAEKGRKDLTYQIWEGGSFVKTITAVRPKINGERFVYVEEKGRRYLRGFRDWELMDKDHRSVLTPKLVEYYAGRYYCVEPPISIPTKVRVRVPGSNKEQQLEFFGHPWLTVSEYLSSSAYQRSHKYDGIMMQTPKAEIRAKWVPTGEAEIHGINWEISALPEISLVRPRQGKKTIPVNTLTAQLRARLRGQYVVQLLQREVVPGPVEQPQVQASDVQRTGAKALVMTVMPGFSQMHQGLRMVMIREKEKPLDNLGGNTELGETPIATIIREMEEETRPPEGGQGWQTTPSMYVDLGSSQATEAGVTYKSYLFAIYMPYTEVVKVKGLELFPVERTLGQWVQGDAGRPRQLWTDRNLQDLAQYFRSATLVSFMAYYMMTVAENVAFPFSLKECVPLQDGVMVRARTKYEAKVLAFGEKMRSVNSSLSPQLIADSLASSWIIDEDLRRKIHSVFGRIVRPELLMLVMSQLKEDMPYLFKELFTQAKVEFGQDFLAPIQLRHILNSWGYTGSDKCVKKLLLKAQQEGIIESVLQSNSMGGRVYRKL